MAWLKPCFPRIAELGSAVLTGRLCVLGRRQRFLIFDGRLGFFQVGSSRFGNKLAGSPGFLGHLVDKLPGQVVGSTFGDAGRLALILDFAFIAPPPLVTLGRVLRKL